MNEEWMMVDEFHVFYVKNEWWTVNYIHCKWKVNEDELVANPLYVKSKWWCMIVIMYEDIFYLKN
jgi:hypothetical protein